VETKDLRVRQKTFRYATAVRWTGDKTGEASSGERPLLKFSSPPEFRGKPGLWTPEDLFVGAVEMCQLLTFMALAKRADIEILSYESNASGTLEFIDGAYRFTEVVVSPSIIVDESVSELDVLDLVKEAHRMCLISNSISTKVRIEPTILQQEPEDVTPG
jgi:organic hydroperoxide reductase OsmC/OhrA